MMHNELINYNSVIDSVIDSAKIKTEDHNMLSGIIHDKLKLGQSDGSPCVPKRQNYIDAVQRRRHLSSLFSWQAFVKVFDKNSTSVSPRGVGG